jgi:hypothetical protein
LNGDEIASCHLIATQIGQYDFNMAPMKTTTLRLSSVQCEMIEKLAQKLQISQADVMRIALSRLAEQEGIKAFNTR